MDEPRDYHTKWSKRQIYDSTYVESKTMIQMNLFMRQIETHRHRKWIYGYKKGMKEEDKLGVWDSQIHTIIYKIDRQQGLPV